MKDELCLLDPSRELLWPRRLVLCLCREILKCIPHPERVESHQRTFAPAVNPAFKLRDVPRLLDYYSICERYQEAWLGQLLVEALASVASGRKEEGASKVVVDVARDQVRCQVTAVRTTLQSHDSTTKLVLVSLRVPPGRDLYDGDLLLLSSPALRNTSLGLIIAFDPDLSYAEDSTGARVVDMMLCEDKVAGLSAATFLAGMPWLNVFVLSSLVTTLREARALDALSSTPFRFQILTHRSGSKY
jgi:hypothetical protein